MGTESRVNVLFTARRIPYVVFPSLRRNVNPVVAAHPSSPTMDREPKHASKLKALVLATAYLLRRLLNMMGRLE